MHGQNYIKLIPTLKRRLMMSNFDEDLKKLLSEQDEDFITDAIDETGYYQSVIKSFKGKAAL